MENCVFCVYANEAVGAEIDGGQLISTHYMMTVAEDIMIIRPPKPVTPGHVLFVPTSHHADLVAAPMLSGSIVEAIGRYARRRSEHFNVITSAGRFATQSIFHVHFHYVPRRAGDELQLPWGGNDA